MKKNKSPISLLFSFTLLLIPFTLLLTPFTFVRPCFAAPIGLSIDPTLLKVQIKPGKSITKVFTIENKEAADKTVVARIVPFTKSDPFGNPQIDLKSKPNWLSYFGLSNSTIKLDEPFVLKAKSKDQLIVSLTIPEKANLEDLYVTLLVSTYDNSLETDRQGSLLSASLGANLLVSVTADLNPATILKIEKIQPLSGSFFRFGSRYFSDNLTPLTFTATAVNNGQFVTETKGNFKVSKGPEVLHLQGILPQNVIALSTRELLNSDGKLFSFSPSLTTFGLHHVSFDIKSENSNTTNSLEIIFLPFKAGLALFISLTIIKIITFLTSRQNRPNSDSPHD